MSKIISHPKNLQILYEDNHLIVINKRPGDIVQGDKTGDKPLSEVVKQYIKEKYNKPGNVYLQKHQRPYRDSISYLQTKKQKKPIGPS